jgi:hypothetical protein
MNHHWKDENAFIKAHYMEMTNTEMAALFHVKPSTLRVRMHYLKLRRTPRPEPETKGIPCPPRTTDMMHTNYVQPKHWADCPRDGGLDFKGYPSRSTGAETVYRRGHP